MRALFLDQSAEVLGPRAGGLSAEALSDLAKFSRLSRLPANIGAWGGHEFVQVAPRAGRPGEEPARVRVSDLVDRLVAPASHWTSRRSNSSGGPPKPPSAQLARVHHAADRAPG